MKPDRLIAVFALCLLAACAGDQPPADRAAEPATDTGNTAAPAPRKSFPEIEYLEQIPYAYRVANEHPELLARIPCYCPCELYGHGGVIDCHRSQHSAACATCLEEAVTAGRMLEAAGASDAATIAEVAAQVKTRYRTAIVQSTMQRGEVPNLQSAGGRAYLTACSDCHQPPHPGMYQPGEWPQSLSRMETYLAERGMEQDPEIWGAAVEFVRSTAARYPAEASRNFRDQLAGQVEHLRAAEGDAAHYPTTQDPILSPEWFERMVRAYRLAREIPAEALAAVPLDDPMCDNLLACLNSGAAVTSEAAVEQVERLAAERGLGDD
jgi:hypothetical protein